MESESTRRRGGAGIKCMVDPYRQGKYLQNISYVEQGAATPQPTLRND